jgi:hypothetical protein
MDDVRAVTSVAGFVAVTAAVAAVIVTRGAYPSVEDTPEQATERLSKPGSVTSLLLSITSIVALVVFATGLRSLIASAGDGWEALATAGALLTASAVAISSTGLGLALMAGWRAQERGPDLARDDSERFVFLNNVSALPAAVGALLLAVGTLAVEDPAGWTAVIGILTGVLHLGIFVSVARRGPLSPTGIFVLSGPPTYYLWVLAVAIVLL